MQKETRNGVINGVVRKVDDCCQPTRVKWEDDDGETGVVGTRRLRNGIIINLVNGLNYAENGGETIIGIYYISLIFFNFVQNLNNSLITKEE